MMPVYFNQKISFVSSTSRAPDYHSDTLYRYLDLPGSPKEARKGCTVRMTPPGVTIVPSKRRSVKLDLRVLRALFSKFGLKRLAGEFGALIGGVQTLELKPTRWSHFTTNGHERAHNSSIMKTCIAIFLTVVLVFASAKKENHDWASRVEVLLTALPDEPTAQETAYLLDSLTDSYNTVHDNSVVARGSKRDDKDRRSRRTRASKWFSIYTHITFHCRLCWDDDWDRRNLRKGKKDEPDESDIDLEQWEMVLCAMLREGPYDTFAEVEDCWIQFLDNN